MSEYNCNSTFANLGNQDCITKLGTPRRIIIVPLTDSDGDVNEFATVAAVTKAALQAKFDASDIKDRFFPTAELANVEQQSEEAKVETDDYGIDYFIRHGVKSFKAMIWGAFYQYLERLSKYNYLGNLGVIIIDNKGNLIYKTDAATKLKVQPIPIKSFYVTDVDAKADSVFKGSLQFKYDLEADDRYLIRYIDAADLNFDGLSTTDVYSLYDVTLDVTAATQTGATITCYIDGDSSQGVTGLVKADLTLVVNGAGVSVTTLTDNGNGTYTAAWTANTGTATLTATKSKYAFNTDSFSIAS